MTMKELAVAISHSHITLSDFETTNFTHCDRFMPEIVELNWSVAGVVRVAESSTIDF